MADETEAPAAGPMEKALAMATALFALALILTIAGVWILTGLGQALVAGAVLLLGAAAWFMHVASTRAPT